MQINIPAEMAKETLQFVQRLLGPVAEATDFLGDKVRFFRWKSALRTIQRAKEIVEEAGIEPKEVPLKFLIPFLEKCSVEDDESELTERWAILLANATAEPTAKLSTYVRILSDLDSEEASLLSSLWNDTNPHEIFRPVNYGNNPEEEGGLNPLVNNMGFTRLLPDITLLREPGKIIFEWHEDDVPNTNELSLVGDQKVIKLLHLQSLGLLRVSHGIFQDSGKRVICITGQLTPFGYDFVTSCENPAE